MTATATTTPTTATRGRFVWHELMTTDLEAAQAFYRSVVGWTAGNSSYAGEYVLWMAGERPAGGLMRLTADAAAMGAPPNWLAYVEVPDVDQTVADTVRLGGGVIVPGESIEQVGRFAVLRDPQGAVFAAMTSAMALSPEADPGALEFSWHELYAANTEDAVAFYEKLFGWEEKSHLDMGDAGVYYMFGRGRFTYGGMMKKSAAIAGPPFWLNYVRVNGTADDAAARVTKAGGTVLVGPMEVPGGDRVAICTDPQGASFGVHSKAGA